MSYEIVVTKTIVKRIHFKGDEEALDEYVEQIENEELDWEDLVGAIEDDLVEVTDTYELED